jgi:hypothetical protein
MRPSAAPSEAGSVICRLTCRPIGIEAATGIFIFIAVRGPRRRK